MKIIIHISGGTLHGVHAAGACEVILVDADDMMASGKSSEAIERTLDALTKGTVGQSVLFGPTV